MLDRNERDWTVNDLRDIVIDTALPMFTSTKADLQPQYFIDKIPNTLALDVNKDWTQQEVLRDKYLIIRLIFNTFDDTKLLLNYSIETENPSMR